MRLKSALIIFLGLFLIKTNAQNLSISNGTLKFPSLAIYEQYADNTLDRNDIVNATTSLQTLGKQLGISPKDDTTESIYPEFLLQILNADKIFTLSRFFVKIDLENSQALVIDVNVPNAYSALVSNNTQADGIMVFNDETDNAMDILEGIENGTLAASNYQSAVNTDGLFRHCSGAPRNTDKGIEIWNRAPDGEYFAMSNKVVYQKFIFFFSLQAKEESHRSYNPNSFPHFYRAILKYNINVKYVKVNDCNKEWINQKSFNGCSLGYTLNETWWRAYEGSRALRKYDLSANFYIKHNISPCTSTDFYPSRLYRIVSGY
ncbi:hypothetical protein [Ferruginibacter sp. SUN106]|uniref:hypothetical protein n=1 Tax=Ferruginibacter sp. SUN106 TaxID=2978348 RepID=UPI003D3652D3